MAVTPDVIATALGRDGYSAIEEQQWLIWINDARLLIEARLGDLDQLDQAKLDYVVREAVVAHVRHPDDATQVSISVDDATSARTYRSGKGRVVILDEWWELLSPTEHRGAFTIDTAPCTASMHLPWCNVMWRHDDCSCGVDIAGLPIFEGGSL